MVHHDRDADCLTDGLVMLVEFLLVRRHVPGGYGHDSIGTRNFCRNGHFNDVLGAVGSRRANDLDAACCCLHGCGIDGNLFRRGQRDHFARAAGRDDAGNAVFHEEIRDFLDAAEIDGLIFVERGDHRNVDASEFFACHNLILL
ncbi:hypothetical protein SDC9_138219 [bioreactor metagenome]|uniref:Uncharacterized protein n=1 Tax=bioreactor metagenome TaxID=1076179 RepID=A0A645DQV3_9ZZZZ